MQKTLLRCFGSLYGIFILLVLTAQTAFCQTPVVHISPKPTWIGQSKAYDKWPPSRTIESGSFDALIEEQVNVEAHATYNRKIIQIVSGSGVQDNSQISVGFNPAYQRLDFHDITVWRAGKPQNRLNAGAFKMLPDEDEFDRFIYNGTYSAKYILADIRKGDRIEYAYTITGQNPIFVGKFCRSIYFQGGAIIAHQYTSLIYSATRPLHIKQYNLLSQPKITTVNGLTRYEWEDMQVPAATDNKRQPEWVNLYAHAQVSEFASWKDVTDWAMHINPIQTTFKSGLAAQIAKLKASSGGDKARYFRSAVKFVQEEVRYMGIETGEYSHRANIPDKVFNQRYGDCKDKSLLLVSILNADGIEAHMVLINTGIKSKLDTYLPANNLFDHACMVATVNGKQIWVDATMADQGGTGTDIYFPHYGKGLILKAGNTGLTDVPSSKTGVIKCNENYVFTDEKSPVTLNVTTTYTLNQADDIRGTLASQSQAETEKNYLKYYKNTYPKIEAVDSVKIVDSLDKNVLTTIESYRIKDFFKRDSISGKYEASFYSRYVYDQLPTVAEDVKTPVNVGYPYAVDHTISVVSPSSWSIEPKHFSLDRNAYKFDYDKSANDDTLLLHYQFAFVKDHVDTAQLAEFRQDVKDLQGNAMYFSFYYNPPYSSGPPSKSDLNPWTVLTVFLIALAFVYLGIWILHSGLKNTGIPAVRPRPIGGWLIVFIVSLSLGMLVNIYNLFEHDYLFLRGWNTYHNQLHAALHRTSFVINFIGVCIAMGGSIICFILIARRRNIFPRVVTWLILFEMLIVMTDFIMSAFLHSDPTGTYLVTCVISIAKSVAWLLYFKRSVRVKQTFVLPYPLQPVDSYEEIIVPFADRM